MKITRRGRIIYRDGFPVVKITGFRPTYGIVEIRNDGTHEVCGPGSYVYFDDAVRYARYHASQVRKPNDPEDPMPLGYMQGRGAA